MVTLKDVRRVIEDAELKTSEMGQPMNISVVDEGGNLISHVRMTAPGSASSIFLLTRPSRQRIRYFDEGSRAIFAIGRQFFGIHVSNHGP
jgi:hypothetical protein